MGCHQIAFSILIMVFAAGCVEAPPEELTEEGEEAAQAEQALQTAYFEPVWEDFNWGGYEFPNVTDPEPNRVLSLGWNIGSNSAPLDPSRPAWMMTFESWYETCPGCDHLHEWHIQWRDTDGTSQRPLTVGVNPEQQSGAVSMFGRTTVHDASGAWQWAVSNGTIWSNGLTQINDVNDTPLLRQKNAAGTNWTEVVRVNASDEVELGRGAGGVRFSHNNKPVVTSCEDLITVLDQMGLVVDGRGL